MKITLTLLLLATVLLSCKNNTKPTTKDNTPVTILNSSQALIQRFKPIIQGIWVKDDYINDITKTRSPYNSRSKLNGVASVTIEMDSIKNDSLDAGVSLNNHEGSDFTIYFKTVGNKHNSLKINRKDYEVKSNFFELGYCIKNNDTSLLIYHYNKDNKLLDSTRYLKVIQSESNNDMGYGIQYITNRILITGKYTFTDSTGHVEKIGFTNEGDVAGFLNFKTFYINTDFIAGPENNLDVIDFDINNNQKEYAFKFNADTLSLYETKDNADSSLLVLGKLKYRLFKTK